MIDVTDTILDKIEDGITSFDEKVGENLWLSGDVILDLKRQNTGGNPCDIEVEVLELNTSGLTLWNEETEKYEDFNLDEDYIIREFEN